MRYRKNMQSCAFHRWLSTEIFWELAAFCRCFPVPAQICCFGISTEEEKICICAINFENDSESTIMTNFKCLQQ